MPNIMIECPECGHKFELDAAHPALRQLRDEGYRQELAAAIAVEKALMAEEQGRLLAELRDKDNQIAYLRDMRARLSTKMVGESLEQHCESEFNRIRAFAFPNAQFGKDNDAKTGSKGDYIFREDADGTELISIMFEMKNEMPDTRQKHRNEDFFKELDKDRREKGCEYAVLVSTLEAGSEAYDAGITDVSWAYPKMYVIRPQCFVPLIGILRNAALSGLDYKRQAEEAALAAADVNLLDSRIGEFKGGFLKNWDSAHTHLSGALGEIDKAVERLLKLRKELETADRQMGLAAKKAEGISAAKLARGLKL